MLVHVDLVFLFRFLVFKYGVSKTQDREKCEYSFLPWWAPRTRCCNRTSGSKEKSSQPLDGRWSELEKMQSSWWLKMSLTRPGASDYRMSRHNRDRQAGHLTTVVPTWTQEEEVNRTASFSRLPCVINVNHRIDQGSSSLRSSHFYIALKTNRIAMTTWWKRRTKLLGVQS